MTLIRLMAGLAASPTLKVMSMSRLARVPHSCACAAPRAHVSLQTGNWHSGHVAPRHRARQLQHLGGDLRLGPQTAGFSDKMTSPGLMSLVAVTQLPTPSLNTIWKGRHWLPSPPPPILVWRARWAGLQASMSHLSHLTTDEARHSQHWQLASSTSRRGRRASRQAGRGASPRRPA